MLKECVPAAGIARLAHSPPLRVDVAHPGNGGGPAPVQASVPRRIPIATDSLVRFCPESNGSKTYAALLSKGIRRARYQILIRMRTSGAGFRIRPDTARAEPLLQELSIYRLG